MNTYTVKFMWTDPETGTRTRQQASIEAESAEKAQATIMAIWDRNLVSNFKFTHEAIE